MVSDKEQRGIRLGIVACEVMKPEIEFLTKDDSDFVVKEYLEFALHEYPQEMKARIIETVNRDEGQLDAALLGYAICNSLEGVTRLLNVPTVMLSGVDCIDAILTPSEYDKEKKICSGTWFITPGWAEAGVAGLIKKFHLDSVEGYEPEFFLDMLFESYQRCLFIYDGIGDEDYYRKKSEDVARDLKLRLDCRTCRIDTIRETITHIKELAMNVKKR